VQFAMKTKVINLKGALFDGEAKSVNAKTQSGEITILPHHHPIISVLASPALVRVEDEHGEHHSFTTTGGFLHLDGDSHLTVLVD